MSSRQKSRLLLGPSLGLAPAGASKRRALAVQIAPGDLVPPENAWGLEKIAVLATVARGA